MVATFRELAQFEMDDLKGKTLISTSIGAERLNSLRERGGPHPDDVPQPFASVVVNEATLEALMLVAGEAEGVTAVRRRPARDDPVGGVGAEDPLPAGSNGSRGSAFVIHPLSQEYFPM